MTCRMPTGGIRQPGQGSRAGYTTYSAPSSRNQPISDQEDPPVPPALSRVSASMSDGRGRLPAGATPDLYRQDTRALTKAPSPSPSKQFGVEVQLPRALLSKIRTWTSSEASDSLVAHSLETRCQEQQTWPLLGRWHWSLVPHLASDWRLPRGWLASVRRWCWVLETRRRPSKLQPHIRKTHPGSAKRPVCPPQGCVLSSIAASAAATADSCVLLLSWQGRTWRLGPPLDLKSLDSVREFVQQYEKLGKPLNILVNNAGANFSRPWKTAEEVTGLVQVNYLGAFALTRLLEKTLISSSPSRVINVSSVTHRFVTIRDAKEFLFNWRKGTYADTKQANVFFSQELHRRLQPLGVDSCAVDPGGVNSSIWDRGGVFSRPPIRSIIAAVYAPPADGASAVVYAATAPWHAASPEDHHFFARGLFASPAVTWNPGPGEGLMRKLQSGVFLSLTGSFSLLDWPIRWMSRHALCSRTKRVPASPAVENQVVSSELWELSCRLVGVPDKP
ncbi:uncharacterized protein LOC142357670 [Convolutriloba macropyga]|uniref:uncharacterized protein LOC142357670 n=1 Tax=Convolutriloba macropyga TaxID=536237 RepID=UPI003F52258C